VTKLLIAICAWGCAGRGEARNERAAPPPAAEHGSGVAAADPPGDSPDPASVARSPADDGAAAGVTAGAGPTQPTTPNYYFKIVELTEAQGESVVVVAIGERTGVSTSWHGTIVDSARRPVKGGELAIVRVQATTATARCKLGVAAIAGHYSHVRLEPP
jgi:hypothetical protein